MLYLYMDSLTKARGPKALGRSGEHAFLGLEGVANFEKPPGKVECWGCDVVHASLI